MPELPEVEIVRRGLEPVMAGRRIARVEQRRPDLRFPLPERFAECLEGQRVTRIERRAKYLLAHLSGGETLLMHLGMTGRFTVAHRKGAKPHLIGEYEYETDGDIAHDHVVLHMSGGATVTYNDPRRFGFMLLVREGDLARHPLLRELGIEPLSGSLTPEALAERAAGRRCDVKALLMDQRVVAGLGNIYACEALFRAGISPRRAASCLAIKAGRPTERARRLVSAIKHVLSEAIDAGGSTLSDYRQADGSRGAFQESHDVYDREGEPCRRAGCGGTVKRIVQQGRSTFHCPRCQR